MIKKQLYLGAVALALLVIPFWTSGAWSAESETAPQPFLKQPDIPQPQGFCGYCHILTYPAIFNQSYSTWKSGKHNKIGCVACHYPPPAAEMAAPSAVEPVKADSSHIPTMKSGHFSYLDLGGNTIATRPRIENASCMTAACHGRPEDTFRTKKIKFTEKVLFVHEPHLAEKNQIEGMRVNCTTCHQHETQTKHFQVTEAGCHLCHFANTKFNQGRARCELCHELPTKPIQAELRDDTKPITHQMLKAAAVTCSSCHFELIQGLSETKVEPFFENGVLKTVLFSGAGSQQKENCLNCHDQQDYLAKATDKKRMHQTHVTVKNARCFDCHQPIRHRRAKTQDPLPADCKLCHPQPHEYQRLLAAGAEHKGIPSIPDPMFKARSGCLACHVEKEISHKGQVIMKASAKTCVRCHSNDYEKMLALWKRELANKVEKTQTLEKKARDALAKQQAGLTPEKLNEARRMLEDGRRNLGIVQFGNGVHNAKYAIALLDVAIDSFENMIGLVEGKDISDSAIQYE